MGPTTVLGMKVVNRFCRFRLCTVIDRSNAPELAGTDQFCRCPENFELGHRIEQSLDRAVRTWSNIAQARYD